MITREEIFNAIARERDYQGTKWGHIHDKGLSIGDWILIMEAELAEAKQGFVKSGDVDDSLLEILQVISVGVACLEQLGLVER